MPLIEKYLCDSCTKVIEAEERTTKYESPEGVAGFERNIFHCPHCDSADLIDWNPEEARRRLRAMQGVLDRPTPNIISHIIDLILEMEETYEPGDTT